MVEDEKGIGRAYAKGLCFGFVVFFDGKDVGEGGDAIFGSFDYSGEEELYPWEDIVFCTGCHDALVVGVAMTLEIVGEVEYGAFEESFADEVEGYEESAGASVTIKERVYGLELIVYDCYFDEVGNGEVVVVDEFFDVSDEVRDGGMDWWYEDGVLYSGSSDPVLGMAVLSWCFAFASYSLHKDLMYHAYES